MAFLASLLVVRPFLRFVAAFGLRAVRLVSDRGRRGDAGWLLAAGLGPTGGA